GGRNDRERAREDDRDRPRRDGRSRWTHRQAALGRRDRAPAWGLLLPGGQGAPVHREPDRARVPDPVRRGAVRQLVLEGAPALLERGLRGLNRAGPKPTIVWPPISSGRKRTGSPALRASSGMSTTRPSKETPSFSRTTATA